jgi:hypothetical protein
MRPISKITRTKRTGDVAQVVQHLLCKLKDLSSNPSPVKKKINLVMRIKNYQPAWWYVPVIPATQEAEAGRSLSLRSAWAP